MTKFFVASKLGIKLEGKVDTPAYYVPESSRLPVLMALSIGLFLFGFGLSIVGEVGFLGPALMFAGLACIGYVMFSWFALVIVENQQGLNSHQLKRSFVMAMAWFITSEVLFFAAFFGSLFYIRVWAVPWLGGEGARSLAGEVLWPTFKAAWPVMTNPDNALFTPPHSNMSWPGFGGLLGWLPLWNTLLLLTSSWTLTIAHHALKDSDRRGVNRWLAITIGLGVVFLFVQAYEYYHAYQDLGLKLGSGIYGSTFFLLTGFHGFHVLLGTTMLIIALLRSLKGHFNPDDHFGFEATAWYWHFVDVVWVCLFVFVYII